MIAHSRYLQLNIVLDATSRIQNMQSSLLHGALEILLVQSLHVQSSYIKLSNKRQNFACGLLLFFWKHNAIKRM